MSTEDQSERRPAIIPRHGVGKLYPFQPGQSGNPAGRRSAGATLLEWLNSLVEADHTEAQLRRMATDKRLPVAKRAAALRLVRLIEQPDLADVEPWLRGASSLADLAAAGVATDSVKRAKLKRIPTSEGEIEERELELYDRSGGDFDRISDRTQGKPRQQIALEGELPVQVAVVFPGDPGFDQEEAGEDPQEADSGP